MKYEDRIVFFFDILGFRDLVNSSAQSNDSYQEIKIILEYVRQFYESEINDSSSKSKQISFFSDSIIISFEESEPEIIFYTLCDVQILLMNLVIRGIVMRGAISFGKLYHDKDFIFGPAFIDAYESETKQAIYPRIICNSTLR